MFPFVWRGSGFLGISAGRYDGANGSLFSERAVKVMSFMVKKLNNAGKILDSHQIISHDKRVSLGEV